MNYVEFINQYNTEIKELNKMKDFINFSLKKLKLKNVMFNVIIINDDSIHKINKEYRNIDRPTDVISFALEDNKQIEVPNIRVLGDIYISYDMAIKQANDYNHSLQREMCFLMVHGLLHLLGYDHREKDEEKVMFNLQKELLNSYGIKE